MELTLDQALRKGIEAHKAGKFQEADSFYTAILKVQPKHPDANHNMGVLAVGIGKIHEAIPFFKTALDSDPKKEQFWISYIDALIELYEIDEARAAFEKAKINCTKIDGLDKLKKKFTSILSNQTNTQNLSKHQVKLVIDLYQQGQLQEALSKASELLLKHPQSVILYNIIGAVNKDLGQLEKAIEAFENALLINPSDADAYNNMGAVLKNQGKLDESIASYKKAIAIRPNNAETYNNIGNVLTEQGNLEDAVSAYKKAIEIKPDYTDAFNNLGNLFFELKQFAESVEYFRQALYNNPYNEKCGLSLALQGLGKYEEAIRVVTLNVKEIS
jgi:tetratricopeptide (TPR) repeat protein